MGNEILEIAVLGTCLGCLAALAFSSMPAVGWGPNDFRAERVAKPGPMLLAGFVLVVVPWLVLQRAGHAMNRHIQEGRWYLTAIGWISVLIAGVIGHVILVRVGFPKALWRRLSRSKD